MKEVLLTKAINHVVNHMAKNDYIAGMFPLLYGRAERLKRYDNGQQNIVPILYQSNGNYEDMRPCDRGNNSFWYVHDGQTVLNSDKGLLPKIRATVSVIFWFGFAKDYRATEEVKNKILWFLNNVEIPNATLKVERIWEESENVFADFTLADDNVQYMMHPYGGLRYECEITVQQECVSNGSFCVDYNEDYE
jgi:hypothetical protein